LVLEYPIQDQYFDMSWSFYLGLFQQKLFIPSYAPDEIFRAFLGEPVDHHCMTNKTLNGLIPFGAFPQTNLFSFKSLINIEQAKVISKCEIYQPEEIIKDEWNQFWLLYNIFQFFPLTPIEEETDLEMEYEI